jgi:hypothetical protein
MKAREVTEAVAAFFGGSILFKDVNNCESEDPEYLRLLDENRRLERALELYEQMTDIIEADDLGERNTWAKPDLSARWASLQAEIAAGGFTTTDVFVVTRDMYQDIDPNLAGFEEMRARFFLDLYDVDLEEVTPTPGLLPEDTLTFSDWYDWTVANLCTSDDPAKRSIVYDLQYRSRMLHRAAINVDWGTDVPLMWPTSQYGINP